MRESASAAQLRTDAPPQSLAVARTDCVAMAVAPRSLPARCDAEKRFRACAVRNNEEQAIGLRPACASFSSTRFHQLDLQ